jgi:hypothetical protein
MELRVIGAQDSISKDAIDIIKGRQFYPSHDGATRHHCPSLADGDYIEMQRRQVLLL